ncbi:MAG TPA: transketolase [Actinophytocola sp.]|jgi:transketolase|uniref:transketolase n=1 Tax=Actinophytocola sp. TaxID=1872138 RepID=UPI002DFBD268|nr:transketolase [Actinophytocola sp.]
MISVTDDTGPRLDHMRKFANQSRQVLLEMIYHANSGHVGSSLSCVDILSVLKFDQMNWSGSVPRTESDVFVLSKGHAVPAWYAALIVSGELEADHTKTLRTIDSQLQGHPDRRRCDLVDVSTGALGQGLSISLGRAQAKRLKGQDCYVYCVAGDGETQEGQVWEALMYAGVREVANLILFVDYNRSQNDGAVDEILPLHPLVEKFAAFRWHVQEIDGHAHAEIRDAIINAKRNASQPSVIIARTRKGHLGEDRVVLNGSHGGTLSADEFRQAIDYLRAAA